MERAKSLLAETSLPISEISVRCGYENLFYFCNAFKKNEGMTPTEFRRGVRK
jgi:AraC-like DNA-binding protein